MRILRPLLGTALLALPTIALAQVNPCPLPGLPCIGGGSSGLSAYLYTNVFGGMRILFAGIALLYFFLYSFRLLVESGEDSTLAEIKNAYGYGITGAALVSLATFVVDAVGRSASDTLINPEPINAGLSNIILYFKILVATSVTILITVQGIRMIVLQGQESEFDKQKQKFFHGIIGVAVILLAEAIVSAIMPGANSYIISEEIRGIANYLLEILGVLIVIAIVVAGVFMTISVDEGLKDRCKKIIFTCVTALIIVVCAYVLVVYFITI